MLHALFPLLLLAQGLDAQAPKIDQLFKPRAFSLRPLLEAGRLPAIPHSEGRPETALRPNQDWFEALAKARRKGRFPATLLLDTQHEVNGKVGPHGWKAYLLLVPGRAKVTFSLQHPEATQFRLDGLDGYAAPLSGTYLSHHPDRNPVLQYRNLQDAPAILVVAVQDPGRLSEATPFTLQVKRTWEAQEVVPRRPMDPLVWIPEVQ